MKNKEKSVKSLPVVAIIGRPNVGKSALFNRLIGKRKALTCDYAGFSRDRNYATCLWGEEEFSIIDTGGWELNSKEQMWQLVQYQLELAINEADLILFMVDGKEGLNPKDKDLFNFIRKHGKETILVVNKIDSEKGEANACQFYQLSSELITISSIHGLNINTLLDKVCSLLSFSSSISSATSEELKIAIVGKPNVGKSSLVNALLGEKRVIVHSIPGTTRDSIDTVFNHGEKTFRLIDTAGIRKRKKTKEVYEKLSVLHAQKNIQRADLCLLVLESSSFSDQDVKIASMIDEGKSACVIVVNKKDLIKKGGEEKKTILRKIKEKLYFLDYSPVLFISAKNKAGLKKMLKTIEKVISEYNKDTKKKEVEKLVLSAYLNHLPHLTKGKRTKIYRAQQVKTSPPLFCVWIKGPLPKMAYRRYIKNVIRQKFNFTGSPLSLIFRKTK
ncbi:ribosome biogenesis GTPase Der [bacterium]|nr:ribosome biogenesis GTPase Der [bacterium]